MHTQDIHAGLQSFRHNPTRTANFQRKGRSFHPLRSRPRGAEYDLLKVKENADENCLSHEKKDYPAVKHSEEIAL
jgi:hypothetical protein